MFMVLLIVKSKDLSPLKISIINVFYSYIFGRILPFSLRQTNIVSCQTFKHYSTGLEGRTLQGLMNVEEKLSLQYHFN